MPTICGLVYMALADLQGPENFRRAVRPGHAAQ